MNAEGVAPREIKVGILGFGLMRNRNGNDKWHSNMHSIIVCPRAQRHRRFSIALLWLAFEMNDIGNNIVDLALSDDEVQSRDSFEFSYFSDE